MPGTGYSDWSSPGRGDPEHEVPIEDPTAIDQAGAGQAAIGQESDDGRARPEPLQGQLSCCKRASGLLVGPGTRSAAIAGTSRRGGAFSSSLPWRAAVSFAHFFHQLMRNRFSRESSGVGSRTSSRCCPARLASKGANSAGHDEFADRHARIGQPAPKAADDAQIGGAPRRGDRRPPPARSPDHSRASRG